MAQEMPPEATEPLIEQIFELWVEPELNRRGMSIDPVDIRKVVVEFIPGRSVHVLVNDEADIVAEVRATRPIAAGEAITFADFDEIRAIRPFEVGPDSGWVCFAVIGQSRIVAFDFRRNRQRARKLLALATQFLETAKDSERSARLHPAIECAYAAAELAVVAQMMVVGHDEPPRDHRERREWWSAWTKLGNAPQEHGRALADLAKRRAAARYGEGSLRIRTPHLRRLLDEVENMIACASVEVGDVRASDR